MQSTLSGASVLGWVLILIFSNLSSNGETSTNSSILTEDERRAYAAGTQFTTPEYEQEVLGLLIDEANRVVRDLNLSEQRPIAGTNLVEVYIVKPVMAYQGFVGMITTTNYVYYVTWHGKFSALDPAHFGADFTRLKMQYLWPTNRMDTNGAFRTATQIMKRAGMDVDGLNRDCVLDISAVMPEGPSGKHFVPDYWVRWKKSGETVALLEFLEPTLSIGELHVDDPKYNLRRAVEVPHLREFLIKNISSKSLLQRIGIVETNLIGSASGSTNH